MFHIDEVDEPDAASDSIEVLRQKMNPAINNTPDPPMVENY